MAKKKKTKDTNITPYLIHSIIASKTDTRGTFYLLLNYIGYICDYFKMNPEIKENLLMKAIYSNDRLEVENSVREEVIKELEALNVKKGVKVTK